MDANVSIVTAGDNARALLFVMDVKDRTSHVGGWHRNAAGMRKCQAPEQKTGKTCYCGWK